MRLVRGVTHAEFLRARADGKFYFIEIASRVGGAYISDAMEAATGINLWREWARIETSSAKHAICAAKAPPRLLGRRAIAGAPGNARTHPATPIPKSCIASPRNITPDFILRARTPQRIAELLDSYSARFRERFPRHRSCARQTVVVTTDQTPI